MNKVQLTCSQKQKIKKIIKCICFTVIILYLLTNVSFSFTLFKEEGTISIAFDKWDMVHVNKAYVMYQDQRHEIADINWIEKISKETRVATRTDTGCSPEIWIELYYNDKLVRRMGYSSCHFNALVYTSDESHWIWPSYEGEGFAELSLEVRTKLHEIMNEE